jgi:ATP-binding cassette subfamily C protein
MSRAAGQEQTRLSKSLTGRLVDVLRGIKPIKAMAREELVLPLLEEETEGLNQAQRRQVLASAGRRLFQEPILTAMLAVTLYFLLEVSGQPFSAVLVLAFIFYRLMQHVNTLQGMMQSVVVGESAFWSLWEQISEAEAAEEDTAQSGGHPVPGHSASISISGVSFGYVPGRPVLNGLDLEIPAGSFVAISGESGSGKTTLADLVLGFHRPTSGSVTVDGTDLQSLSLREWRRQIGYVPQELLLFNQSILMNVTLGDDALSREDVERALRQAGAWGFVSERDKGMDSLAGEQGGQLSGGQRQRIAIARALVHRPSLLILDEVTTALDPATEQGICDTLTGLAGEVTILSISHQPAMRRAASQSYLMREGKLEPVEAEATSRGVVG